MGGFLGYNLMLIAELDQEKPSFTTSWGTYCDNVKPFGLKNARATYQRAMLGITNSWDGWSITGDTVGSATRLRKKLALTSLSQGIF